MNVENSMVIDTLWKEKEQESVTFGECAGCQEDIHVGEDIYVFEDYGEQVLLHQNSECCMQYISEMSVCRIAGE